MEEWSDDDRGAALLSEPAVCSILNGVVWFGQAFQFFAQRWLNWLLLCGVMWGVQCGIWMGAKVVPALLFSMPFAILMFVSGIMYAASAQEFDEEAPSLNHLFVIFSSEHYLNSLLLYLFILLGGGGIFYYLDILLLSNDWFQLQIALLFFAVCLSFLWFTPALVFLQGENPFSAVLLSLKTAWRNIFPMMVLLILQLVVMAAVFLGLLPIMQEVENRGYMWDLLLVALMVGQLFMMLGCYAAYRDIWFED